MKIEIGNTYFVSDAFYEKIKDPFLKINYEESKRPHYFAFKDDNTNLYWLVPCSSRVDKFKAIIESKKLKNKPSDSIKIVKLQGKQVALLFQDMFPIVSKYIEKQYVRGGQPVLVADPKVIQELEKTAKKVSAMLKRGICFTPTQPDVKRIEKLMIEELENIRPDKDKISMADVNRKIEKYKEENSYRSDNENRSKNHNIER